jgi:hypothetical protein
MTPEQPDRLVFPADIHRIAADIRRQALQNPDKDPVVPRAKRKKTTRTKATRKKTTKAKARKTKSPKTRARKTTRARRK